MLPPPPGLFSTTAGCLRRSCKPVAISRPTTSLDPPGVNGMMMRMVLLGKLCAQADEKVADVIAVSATTQAPRSCFMLTPFVPGRRIATPRKDLLKGSHCPRGGPLTRVLDAQSAPTSPPS